MTLCGDTISAQRLLVQTTTNGELFRETNYINSPASELNVAKLDVAALTPRFTFEATRRYHLDMNFIDPADGKNVAGFYP